MRFGPKEQREDEPRGLEMDLKAKLSMSEATAPGFVLAVPNGPVLPASPARSLSKAEI